jgi:chromosomal replication initiation ATPase DnaA
VFATWLRPLERAWWDGDVFVIEVPTAQFREWLNGTYRPQVKAALRELHYDGPVKFSVRPREPATVHDGSL